MKLLKPSWVHHDEKPIFSIDVHQECLKFATGGQGLDSGSGRIVIWNLLPVLSEKAEMDTKVPKVLCQMDQHLGCVNCVRWSQNGLLLASGSDDKLVMIWRKSQGTSGVFGTGGIKKNPESWKCAFTLRGHAGDVLDLAWSPQDRYLASCSIDNTIIVWDALSFPLIVTTLKGHAGLVKGVSWDPVGKFLASQSDDRSIRIWKTSDWSCSETIKEPFEECGGTTHILRLCWSPDGQYLVSAHAMNSGGPTAQIIEREGWKCDKDFVGHRKAVTCVRFNTAILMRKSSSKSSVKRQQYCCLAVGSRDRSLSVWMTALPRPMVVIHDLFNDSVLDLSWGPLKCILMACSGDGTVACLQFTDDELGSRISEDHKNFIFQRMYGKNVLSKNGMGATQSNAIVENPELLSCSQSQIKPPTLPGFSESNSMPPPPTFRNGVNANNTEKQISLPAKAISKQMETRTADGKRRITPMFIPMNQDVNESTNSSSINSSSRPPSQMDAGTVIISNDNGNIMSDVKSNIAKDFNNAALDSRLIMSSKKTAQPATFNAEQLNNFPLSPNRVTRKPTGPQLTNFPAHQASTTGPKVTITPTTKNEFYKSALDYRISVQNGSIKTNNGMLARVIAHSLSANERLWEVFVGSPIVNFNFCLKYVLLCSLDGTVRLLDMHTGRSVLPAIALITSAVQCAFCPDGKMVAVVTECGILRIWNIIEQRATLAITCNEVLGKHGAILHLTLTDKGVPLIAFGNGHSYSYSQRLQSWLVINTNDPIMYHGLRSTLPRELQKNCRLYPLLTTQTSTHTYTGLSGAMELNTESWQPIAKISFIENQIKLCESIDSPEELKHWYYMLVYHLAISGTEKRLRLLLDDLLGTPSAMEHEEHNYILNISKHDLLEGALDTLKPHMRWQRIYTEYMELYKFYKSERNESLFTDKRNKSKQKHKTHRKEDVNVSGGGNDGDVGISCAPMEIT